MSVFKLFSGAMATACVVWAVPAAALAPTADNLLLAQAQSSDLLRDLDAQPDAPEDLVIENLTDEQAAQIVAIFDQYQPQIDAATADYLETLAVLNDLLIPQTSDLALSDARNNAVAARQAIDDLVFQRNLALRSVLTLQQRQIINDYLRTWLDLPPVDTAAVFPMNLVGLEANQVLPDLQAEGWEVVVQTPGLVELNRGSQELNLDVDRGLIVEASLGR